MKNDVEKNKKKLSKNTFLFLKIFQNGILQIEKKVTLGSFFLKKIRIGNAKSSDLFIPFSKIFCETPLFVVGRQSAQVILDPRFEGFLTLQNKFGTFSEFIMPKGAFFQLSSIEEPMTMSLEYGARGKIKFLGYDITFKIEKIDAKTNSHAIVGAQKKLFQLPEFDDPIERKVIPISMLATALTFIPLLLWLVKSPQKLQSGIINLSTNILNEFIAPENMRFLPFIYKEKFQEEEIQKLAILWIFELQKRWGNNKSQESQIPFLQNAPKYTEHLEKIDALEKNILLNYSHLEEQRRSKKAKRYFSFLKPYTGFTTTVTGQEGSSQFVTLLKRLNQMDKTDTAILEYLTQEHFVLKTHYEKNYNAKKIGIVEPPATGQVLGPQPDKSFYTEFKNYKIAESYAFIAENSKYRKALRRYILDSHQPENQKSNKRSYSTIWISQDGLLLPNQAEHSNKLSEENNFSAVWHNAMYSVGLYKIPPLPPKKATINLKLVAFVIYNKNEEIRACYNAALRKNPKLQGQMTVRWSILENGKADRIRILKSNFQEKSLITCLKSRLQVWSFPKPLHGPVTVTYPFRFKVTNKN